MFFVHHFWNKTYGIMFCIVTITVDFKINSVNADFETFTLKKLPSNKML